MRVQMRVSVSGTRDGQAWPKRGEVLEVSEREARRMVAAGHAVAVGGTVSDRETAVQPEPETRKSVPKKRPSGLTKKSLVDGDAESA